MKNHKKFIKTKIRDFVEEQELHESIFDRFKKNKIFKQNPNTWTHATYSEELINHIKSGGDFIGKKEDLSEFNIPIKGKFNVYTNQHSPNFKKGSIFQGFETHPYLITSELPDESFQPNWNGKNYDNLKDSQNVGVLKPEYRESKHFILWKRNKNGEFELIK